MSARRMRCPTIFDFSGRRMIEAGEPLPDAYRSCDGVLAFTDGADASCDACGKIYSLGELETQENES